MHCEYLKKSSERVTPSKVNPNAKKIDPRGNKLHEMEVNNSLIKGVGTRLEGEKINMKHGFHGGKRGTNGGLKRQKKTRSLKEQVKKKRRKKTQKRGNIGPKGTKTWRKTRCRGTTGWQSYW